MNKNFIKVYSTSLQYDVFIPSAKKDEFKIPLILEGVLNNLDAQNVYICSPSKIENQIKDSRVNYLLDDDVFNFDRKRISFRPNWTYQQFLKMFFSIGINDHFVSLDCDSIILKKLNWFEGGLPVWRYGWDQHHNPYFAFNEVVFDLKKSLQHTGIGDVGFFDRRICSSFLNYCSVESPGELLSKFCSVISPGFHPSEFEIYSNFVNAYYPGRYVFKKIKQQNYGKRLDFGQDWTLEEIKSLISKHSSDDTEIMQVHSWKI
jgi:hypothetical protein